MKIHKRTSNRTTRSLMKGMLRGPALAVSGTALFCLTAGSFSAARTGLPTTIRLVRSGIAGDRYVTQSTSRMVLVLRFEKDGKIDESVTDSTEMKTDARRVTAIAADGGLTVEERPTELKRTVISNGQREVVTALPAGHLVTYKSSGELVSRGELPKPDDPDKTAPIGGDPPPFVPPDPDARLTTEPPFPDKPLHVGDTWSGTVHMLPNQLSSDPDVNFTGKLTAIELHQSVPCARVEYTFTATSTKLPKLISKLLSEEATGKGTIKVTGTATEYYTLDRGAVLETEGKSAITMRFDLTEPNPQGDDDLHRVVKVTIKTTGSSTTTKAPAYNASLVPDSAVGQ